METWKNGKKWAQAFCAGKEAAELWKGGVKFYEKPSGGGGEPTKHYLNLDAELWIDDENPWIWASLQDSGSAEIASAFADDITLGHNELDIDIWVFGTIVQFEFASDWDWRAGILSAPLAIEMTDTIKFCFDVVTVDDYFGAGSGDGWVIPPGSAWIEIGE